MSIQAALDAAGGFAAKSTAQQSLFVVRTVDGKQVIIDATGQTAMIAADTLFVPVER